jgi:hypothetical protein
MNAAYYAELSALLRQRHDETKPAHDHKYRESIDMLRYHLLAGSTKALALSTALAVEERAKAESKP